MPNSITKWTLTTAAILAVLLVVCLCGCGHSVDTPNDTKYLQEFHLTNFAQQDKPLKEGRLNLYVDYSTCCALGQNSLFFQDVSASLVNKTTDYYAIQGSEINKVGIAGNGGVYTLLRNISEVNYAELAGAAQQMADADCESVLLTDGEYFTPSIAKGHDNDPWLANSLKTWILKGHDVHIISEPYMEGAASKKRFYIMFTDDRLANNIYERIRGTVNFQNYPKIDEFHISASHPKLFGDGNNGSTQNEILQSKSQGYGTFEVEDWDGCDWKTIEDNIVCAVNNATGKLLPNGAPVIQMGIDKNSFGCYRIKSLAIKAYNINQEYFDFYTQKDANPQQKVQRSTANLPEIENFMLIDKQEFDRHSKINIHFNQSWFTPDVLDGKPYNYLKVDLTIQDIEPIFSQHESMFEFDSISLPGTKNVSVASSIKQCLADDAVKQQMLGQVIYTIYIKSESK